MSQDFADPEIFADFIVEAKEHLETIEPTLLELEKTPDNLVLLNDIFRPMHSLKGASGFLGLNKINGLAHKAENILDELRTGNIQVTTEIMDVILASTDALRTMIDNLETTGVEGDVETESIIKHIEALLAGESISESAQQPIEDEVVEESFQNGTSVTETGEEEAVVGENKNETASENGALQMAIDLPDFESETYKLTIIGEDHLADFLEEAHEIVENLNSSLVELEKNPTVGGELVNDIFRYFHNLKGNSGIIGYKELNSLTHEAETLLNRVRKGEMEASHAMIDLLLSSIDKIDELLSAIEAKSGMVTTVDARLVSMLLQKSSEEGIIYGTGGESSAGDSPSPQREPEGANDAVGDESSSEDDPGFDKEDIQIFSQTVSQQLDNIDLALKTLRNDSDNKDYIDGLFRCLTTVQNSSGYMGFEDIKVYGQRTAGLVDQARKSGVGFELMVDILEQECSILKDMIVAQLETLGVEYVAGASAGAGVIRDDKSQPSRDESVSETAAPTKQEETKPEPAVETPKPEPKPEPKAETAPKAAAPAQPKAEGSKPAAPKAAQKAAAKPATPKAAPAQQAAAQPKPKTSSTIRVDHEKLDHLMNLIGELIINRNRFSMLARSLEEGQLEVQEIAQSLNETTDAMNRISDDLQDTIMNVRMVPVGSVFSRFPRLVRDLSRKSEKKVELIMEGEDTELDKSVVEVIGDPLVHMIRNSVDHGLESEADRVAAGKNAVGKVWLRAYHKGNSVAIEVEDDGKGIDPEKIRASAVKKGIITPEQASQMDERESLELIFAPGFSSAEKVTDISGRGVGMDVVRSNIKNLKGSVTVVSEVGKGTKISLTLPLTLAIIDALMVTVSSQTFAIPLDAVSETTKIEAERLTDVNKRKALELRGEVLGVIELAEMLDLEVRDRDTELLPMVVLQDNERRLGIVVDRLLERQEIVIKPLGSYLSDFDLKGISGATIMGDGSVVLILDPHEIYAMAARN